MYPGIQPEGTTPFCAGFFGGGSGTCTPLKGYKYRSPPTQSAGKRVGSVSDSVSDSASDSDSDSGPFFVTPVVTFVKRFVSFMFHAFPRGCKRRAYQSDQQATAITVSGQHPAGLPFHYLYSSRDWVDRHHWRLG